MDTETLLDANQGGNATVPLKGEPVVEGDKGDDAMLDTFINAEGNDAMNGVNLDKPVGEGLIIPDRLHLSDDLWNQIARAIARPHNVIYAWQWPEGDAKYVAS